MLFKGLSFSLGPGDAAQVQGANGTGKSSLIRVIAGLLPAFAGTVEREGALALTDERLALDANATLGHALGHWGRLDGAATEQRDAALAALDLAALADVPVRMFSTGQRKRAALARVVQSGAPIWLLDEPANGLDTASIERLGAAIAVHRAAGGIVLAASHQPLPLADAQVFAITDYAP